MKLLFAFSLFLASFSSTEWLTDFNKAQEQAAQSKKMILLNFSGSDWCGPCMRLKKEIFNSDEFNKYASENLVLVNADFPRLKKNLLSRELTKQNEALSDKYNKEGQFPFTVLLNSDGRVIKAWDGLPAESPQAFVEQIKKIYARS